MGGTGEKRGPHFIRLEVGGVVANTATVVSESFRAPSVESVIVGPDYPLTPPFTPPSPPPPPTSPPPPPPGRSGRRSSPAKPPTAITLSPAFKMIFIVVVLITLLSGIAVIILAALWESPTPNQQGAFESFNFAWKMGLGAIFGLLGAKLA